MSTRFHPDRRFEAQLAVETAATERQAARDAQRTAQATAPVRTGNYRESIQVLDEAEGATLYTDDPIGHILEWGSVNARAYRVLTNAALQTADRVDLR